MTTNQNPGCSLCSMPGGDLLYEDAYCRVVLVTDDEGRAFPGFCRVISQVHVREMSDLPADAQRRILDAVIATERALRQEMQPDKINLASLGNMVPHVHWHVIPRWADDSHFPGPIWAAPQRVAASRAPVDAVRLRESLEWFLHADCRRNRA